MIGGGVLAYATCSRICCRPVDRTAVPVGSGRSASRLPRAKQCRRPNWLGWDCNTCPTNSRHHPAPDGQRIFLSRCRWQDAADKDTLAWIRSPLAIPPAWQQVWICPQRNGHLLATGRDARGRKQYRYHPRWRSLRDDAKFDRMLAFARALPPHPRRGGGGAAQGRPGPAQGAGDGGPPAGDDAHPGRQRRIRAVPIAPSASPRCAIGTSRLKARSFCSSFAVSLASTMP